MPHVHELIDFTVNAYIVHDNKVLLVDHKKYGTWLPIGGHIELNEDPEEALLREIKEECGLAVAITGERPVISGARLKPLLPPKFMDIHEIDTTHRHINLVYIAIAETDTATLAQDEHRALRWFTRDDLVDPQFGVRPAVRFYAEQALKIVADKTAV